MFQRLLIDRMEHRILVGTLAFLGIMVVLGWIAINEGGRMQSFDREFTARAIERGASLFAANCSTCHGEDGRGIGGNAPGLNNPQFFGHDFMPEISAEEAQLNIELAGAETTDARKTEINARLAELATQRQQIATEQMTTAVQNGYDPAHWDRLEQLKWAGGRRNLVYTTLVHGRPNSFAYYPAGRQMPAWSQLGGGPLRNDQLNDLTEYILNFDKGANWTIEDLNAVQQFALMPGEGGGITQVETPVGVNTPTTELVTNLEGLTGDPNNGQSLYTSLACAGCHVAGVVAPPTEGTWTRVQEVRLQDPQFEGYTGEAYLAESIIHPQAYIVPGFQPLMPPNFGERVDYQMLADLIAYLKTQEGPVE
jgi:mono/diheme cytochrome c family protein